MGADKRMREGAKTLETRMTRKETKGEFLKFRILSRVSCFIGLAISASSAIREVDREGNKE